MAYNQLLSVSVVRYPDGTTRPSIWITRFDRLSWERDGANPDRTMVYLEPRRYDWTDRNFRRLRPHIPATFQLRDLSRHGAYKTTWQHRPEDRIIGTDW